MARGVLVLRDRRRLLFLVALEYAGHILIGFDDRSYRWITVKRFTYKGSGSDEEILAALTAHWRYRDSFLSADSQEQDTKTVHGPYWVAEITASSFDRIERIAAAAVVDAFCGLYGCPPRPEVRNRIQTVLMSALQESVCYRLRNLPHAMHEYAFALIEFRELALLQRNAGVLLSAVMAID